MNVQKKEDFPTLYFNGEECEPQATEGCKWAKYEHENGATWTRGVGGAYINNGFDAFGLETFIAWCDHRRESKNFDYLEEAIEWVEIA